MGSRWRWYARGAALSWLIYFVSYWWWIVDGRGKSFWETAAGFIVAVVAAICVFAIEGYAEKATEPWLE